MNDLPPAHKQGTEDQKQDNPLKYRRHTLIHPSTISPPRKHPPAPDAAPQVHTNIKINFNVVLIWQKIDSRLGIAQRWIMCTLSRVRDSETRSARENKMKNIQDSMVQ